MPLTERIRKKLLKQRRDLFQDVAGIEDDLLWLETDVEPEAEERGQNENLLRLLSRLDDRQKAEIEEIDRALTKITMGTYGRCEACGRAIPWARLEALPTAATCLPCTEGRSRPPS